MLYKLRSLSNGLRVLIVPVASLESATLTVWVKTGSRNEEKRIGGISHFLEHMVFKGSKKRPTAKEISEVVDSFGGEFNAATSKDWTNFYIKARTASLSTAFDVLSDMVLNPILNKDEIEREKGTIIQELAMYEDTPMIKIQDVFEGLAFSGNPLAWDIGGTPKSVRAINRDDFLRYRNTHYYPENMLLTVAGGVNESDVIKLAEKYFSGLEKNPKPLFKQVPFKSKQVKSELVIKNKKTEQANFILGFLSEGRGYKGRFAQSVLNGILAGGMSSRLFIEVRERRGLAYAVKPSGDKFDEVGFTGAYAGTDPGKAEEAIKVILDQMYGLASGKYPVSQKELEKSKEYLKGHLALSLEDTNAVNDFFGEQALFLDEVLTPEKVYGEIDKVSVEDVLAEAKKIFLKDHLNLAIIGPYTNKEVFKKLIS